jgi:hypothetical protein
MTKLEFTVQLLYSIPLHNIKHTLPLELLQHLHYIKPLLNHTNLVYCPSPAGYKFDACIFNLKDNIINQTLEFKFKEGSGSNSFYGPKKLFDLQKEFSPYEKNVDLIDLGFKNQKSFEKQFDFVLEEYNGLSLPKINVTNYSSN